MTDSFKLNARAKAWIAGIKQQFKARPIPIAIPLTQEHSAPAFKIL